MFRIINLIPFEKKDNYYLDRLHDVSILIKTLERPTQLKNLLYSIQILKFNGPIIIADDSRVPYKEEVLQQFPDLKITYISLPFDTGTAEGRNLMLERVNTKYFVLCDDDFIFEPRTRIPVMQKLLIDNNFDILGGVFRQYNLKSRKAKLKFTMSKWLLKFNILIPATNIFEYHAGFDLDGKICRMKKIHYKDPFSLCDMTHNFFMASTEKVKSIGGWNPLLKGGEHQNFFIRAKLKGLKVATTRQCGVIHDRWTPPPALFKELRDRSPAYKKLSLVEFGIEHMENYKEVMKEDYFT